MPTITSKPFDSSCGWSRRRPRCPPLPMIRAATSARRLFGNVGRAGPTPTREANVPAWISSYPRAACISDGSGDRRQRAEGSHAVGPQGAASAPGPAARRDHRYRETPLRSLPRTAFRQRLCSRRRSRSEHRRLADLPCEFGLSGYLVVPQPMSPVHVGHRFPVSAAPCR